MEAFSGAITFNVRVDLKLYIPFKKLEIYSNVECYRENAFKSGEDLCLEGDVHVMLEIYSNVECYRLRTLPNLEKTSVLKRV